MKYGAIMMAAMLYASPSLAQQASAPAPEAGTIPRFQLVALRSDDIKRSIAFYTQGLGMVQVSNVDTATIAEAGFGFAGDPPTATRIVLRKNKAANAPPITHGNAWESLIMRVPDVGAIATRLKAGGYAAVSGPAHPRYKILQATDPDGHRIDLLEILPAK